MHFTITGKLLRNSDIWVLPSEILLQVVRDGVQVLAFFKSSPGDDERVARVENHGLDTVQPQDAVHTQCGEGHKWRSSAWA